MYLLLKLHNALYKLQITQYLLSYLFQNFDFIFDNNDIDNSYQIILENPIREE